MPWCNINNMASIAVVKNERENNPERVVLFIHNESIA